MEVAEASTPMSLIGVEKVVKEAEEAAPGAAGGVRGIAAVIVGSTGG